MKNGDESRSNVISEAETAAKKVKQETPGDGEPPDAPSHPQEQNPSLQGDVANQHLPRPPVNLPNYPMQPHLTYNPMAPFLASPPHQFPFIPPQQHATHYHPPQNVPFPPPFHLPQPQYPNPNGSIQYYEARMRDHAAA